MFGEIEQVNNHIIENCKIRTSVTTASWNLNPSACHFESNTMFSKKFEVDTGDKVRIYHTEKISSRSFQNKDHHKRDNSLRIHVRTKLALNKLWDRIGPLFSQNQHQNFQISEVQNFAKPDY